jgi:predicted deacetylase
LPYIVLLLSYVVINALLSFTFRYVISPSIPLDLSNKKFARPMPFALERAHVRRRLNKYSRSIVDDQTKAAEKINGQIIIMLKNSGKLAPTHVEAEFQFQSLVY